jgi:opacity protein-like surface antigen
MEMMMTMMRRRSVAALAGALGVILAAGTAEAQLRPWEISIAGGPSFPVGELRDEAGTGFHVQGSVGFDLGALPFGVRLDALWQEVPDVTEGWFRQVGGLANLTFGLPISVISPYALVGVGYLRTTEPDVDHGDHGHEGGAENLLGVNAGIGIEFPFAGLGGFIEARYLNLAGSGEATHFRVVPVSIGIRF